MAKIIPFKPKHQKTDIVSILEELLEEARAGNYDSLIVAAESKDKEFILTAHSGIDIQDRYMLIAHLQTDVMHSVVRENLDQEGY